MWGDDHLTIKTLWNRWGKIIAKNMGFVNAPYLLVASELILDWVGSKKILGSQISFHEIAFLAVFNIFPIQKLIFGHF